MLTSQEKKRITEEFKQYEQRPGACIDALKIVQESRGWISDEAVKDIAEFLGMAPDDVDGVATFYNLIFRKPVGRNVILVCDSVSCWVMGCNALRDQIKNHLGIGYGETTADGQFTVLPNACLGACDQAPVIMIGDQIHPRVSADQLTELLSHAVQKKGVA